MDVLIEGIVGPRPGADGSEINPRMSKDASIVTQDGHGRYTEVVSRGNVFLAANQAAAIFSGGLTTSIGTLTLTNPPNSGKNLAILQAEFILQNIPLPAVATGQQSTAVFLVAQPYNSVQVTQNNPLTVRNALIGSNSAAVGLAASGSTLQTTPVIVKQLTSYMFLSGAGPVGATFGASVANEIAGALILSPGTALAFGSTNVVTGSCSILWEELPI